MTIVHCSGEMITACCSAGHMLSVDREGEGCIGDREALNNGVASIRFDVDGV